MAMRRLIPVIKLGLVLLVSATLSGCTFFSKNSYSGIQIQTNETSSNIFLDDNYIGRSPLIEHNLKPGTYTLKITPEDASFVSYETTVTLHKGTLTVVAWNPATTPELSGGVIYDLEPLRSKTTEVSLTTIPDNAIVNFGNYDKEFSPHVFTNVTPGHTEVEVTLPSYETQKHTLDIIPGYRMNLSFKLAKLRSSEEELKGNNGLDGTNTSSQEASTSGKTQDSSPSAQPQNQNNNNEASSATSSASSTKLNTLPPPRSAKGSIKINPTNYFENDIEVLRVRKSTPYGQTIGFAPVGSLLPYLNEKDEGWLKVWFKDQEGWVSEQYAQIVE